MIEVVLSCEADGCRERLVLQWPRGDYVALIDPAVFGGRDGELSLDGAAKVPAAFTGWRVAAVRPPGGVRGYVVSCPAHAAEL